MKLKIIIPLIVFLAIFAAPARPQQSGKPLTKDQVMGLAKAGMETPDLIKLIRDHGIDFDLSDDFLEALRQAGAQEPVIQALRAARPKALTKEQVLKLVVGHVPSQRAAELVGLNGIDFLPDEPYFDTLRLAGADDALIAALRTAGESVTAQFEVKTSPDAEVFLDGQSVGRAATDGRLAAKSKPGVHVLKISLAGKQDFEQKVTLDAGQENKLVAALADLPREIPVHPAPGAKGYLGISIGDLNDILAKQFKSPDTAGALIQDVTMGAPADKAGVKAGDVIREINGQPVANAAQLTASVMNLSPGAVAILDILRDGQPLTLEATLSERPAALDVRADVGSVDQGTLRGISVETLTPSLRDQWRLPPGVRGVLIVQLDPKSPAVQAGLQAGDAIEEINRQLVLTVGDFTRLAAQVKGDTLVRIHRQGNGVFVIVSPDKGGDSH